MQLYALTQFPVWIALATLLLSGPAFPELPQVLDLETAQRITLEENPSLAAAAARIAQAKARVRQAESAYYPQIEASYAMSRTWLPDRTVDAQRLLAEQQAAAVSAATGGVGGSAGFGSADVEIDEHVESHSLGVTGSYLLFDGFQRKFRRAAAQFGEAESAAGLDEARRLLLDAVAGAYYAVQLARENIDIATANEEFNARLLKDATARERVGSGAYSDVLNFEVQQRSATAARLDAERDHAVARIGLAALMGLPGSDLGEGVHLAPLPEEHAAEELAPDTEAAITTAEELRPDVRRARLSVARTDAQHRAAKGVYYPNVSAFASQSFDRDTDSKFRGSDRGATVGVQVNLTLFAGGRNRATVVEAREVNREAEWLLTDTLLNAAADVREALAALHTAQAQLALQRETTRFVEENRNLVEKAYLAGGPGGSLTRLNEAQRDLTSAQGRLAQARVSLLQSWHAFRTATGETLAAFDAGVE